VGVSAEFDFPAERAFPVSVVVGHGLLASTTFTLVLLTVLGVGRQLGLTARSRPRSCSPR